MLKNSYVGIIPARGGSKGIPRKNIKDFLGKPLLAWTIEAARDSGALEDIIVSTDDAEIASIALDYGASVPYIRSNDLARDDSSTIDVLIDIILQLDLQCNLVLLQPTSPLRTSSDIWQSVESHRSVNSGSLVSVCKSKSHPLWSFTLESDRKIKSFSPTSGLPTRRQDMKQSYVLNGAIYISDSHSIIQNKSFINDDTYGFEMPRQRSVDIDDDLDWKIAEFFSGASKCDEF
jgi:CMP-N-acetylneuraminic acid synthetase